MNTARGCPPIPNVPDEVIPFLELRPTHHDDPTIEGEVEWVDSRTAAPVKTFTDISFLSHACEVRQNGELGILHESVIHDPKCSVVARELAARWLLWSKMLLPESVGENPQLLSEADAEIALANHLETLSSNE